MKISQKWLDIAKELFRHYLALAIEAAILAVGSVLLWNYAVVDSLSIAKPIGYPTAFFVVFLWLLFSGSTLDK